MSTQPTDDESPPPTPTAQRSEGPIPSAVLDRRTFLRGTAAAGAATIAGTGMASADDTRPAYPEYQMPVIETLEWAGGVLNWDEDELDEPTADETNLHLQVQSEGEWYDEIYTVSDNFLGDMRPVAHIDARDGISNAYLDGENASGGYDRALDRITEYYSAREQNEINAGLRVLTNFAHICDAAQANDDVDDALLTLHCERADTDEHCLGVVTTDFTESTFDLMGDHSFETRLPMIEFYEPAEDGLGEFIGETLITPNTIQDATGEDWWDVTISFDTDPENITTSGSWNLQNLPDYEDDDGDLEFPGIGGVWHMGEWVAQINKIDNERASVQANYDEDLVDQLYQAFDDGDADPSDVRGSVGLARHMGGTEDAYADSYRLALMMQLGLEQQDLEHVASMTVNYSGATARNVQRDDDSNHRNIYPGEFVEDREMGGVLNARETPEQGIVTGEKLAAQPHIVGVDTDAGRVEALSLLAGSVTGSGMNAHDDIESMWDVSISPDGNREYVRDTDDDTLYAYDRTTDEVLWTAEAGSTPMVSPNGEYIANAGGQGNISYVYDTDGNTVLDTGVEAWSGAISNDSEKLFVSSGDDAHVFEIESGDELWHTSYAGGSVYGPAWTADDEGIIIGHTGGNTARLDAETGDEEWSFSLPDVGESNVLSPDGETVYTTGRFDEIFALDPETGDELHHFNGIGDGELLVDVLGNVYNCDTEIHRFDADLTNDELLGEAGSGGAYSIWPDPHAEVDFDGFVDGALFFDSTEGEELRLAIGAIEIVEQTDSDGNEVEQSDTFTPEHDTNNVEDWTKTVEKHTTVYEETIVNNYDTGDDDGAWWPSVSGNFDGGFGGQLAGLAVIAAIVISVVWSVVSDAIPFLGN